MQTFPVVHPYPYKGFLGETLQEDGKFVIKVKNTTDFITDECETADKIQDTFHELVDDYIETCAEIGKEPVRT